MFDFAFSVVAAECDLIANLATDKAKRELFKRLSKHLATFADEVEHEMAKKRSAS